MWSLKCQCVDLITLSHPVNFEMPYGVRILTDFGKLQIGNFDIDRNFLRSINFMAIRPVALNIFSIVPRKPSRFHQTVICSVNGICWIKGNGFKQPRCYQPLRLLTLPHMSLFVKLHTCKGSLNLQLVVGSTCAKMM